MTRDVKNVKVLRLQSISCPENSYHMALMCAQNPYVVVTHDDDIMKCNYVEACFEILGKHKNIGLIASNVSLIDEESNELSGRLYSRDVLNKDLLIRRRQYAELYAKKKLWLPTTTHCINRKLYFDYYKRKNSVLRSYLPPSALNSKKRGVSQTLIYVEEAHFQPSGDLVTQIALNEKSDLYLFSEPMFSYRQHVKQQSRNVNQSDPMIYAAKQIAEDPYFSSNTRACMRRIEAKYSVQEAVFSNDFSSIKSVLAKYAGCNSPLITLMNKLLFGKKIKCDFKNGLEEHVYTELLDSRLNAKIFKDSYIVLIGSMLLSYILKLMLEQKGFVVSAIVDRAPARHGALIGKLRVLTYGELNDRFKSDCSEINRNVVIVSTSERRHDKAVVAYAEKFFHASKRKHDFKICTWENVLINRRNCAAATGK